MGFTLKEIEVEYPYHLCPICGLVSDSSSRVCSKHSSYTVIVSGFWKDSMGRLILDGAEEEKDGSQRYGDD